MSRCWLVRLKDGYACNRDAGGWRVTSGPAYVGHMGAEMALFCNVEDARRYRSRQTPLVANALEIVRVSVEVCDD